MNPKSIFRKLTISITDIVLFTDRESFENYRIHYKCHGVRRLIGVRRPNVNEWYSYDRAGNRISYADDKGISESYNYNETNELLSIVKSPADGGVSEIRKFTYDADGNMTSDVRGIYSYDGFNRMEKAVMKDGQKLICRYDAEGLRHETEENGRLVASEQ